MQYVKLLILSVFLLLVACLPKETDLSSGTLVPGMALGQKDPKVYLKQNPMANGGLNWPYKPIVVNGKFIVSDSGNNRVLIYNSFPTASLQAADVVLGQFTMINGMPNKGYFDVTATSLNRPLGIASDGTHLVVVDNGNNRVLIWNSIPTLNDTPADVVIGQSDFSGVTQGLSATQMDRPMGALIFQGKLYVVDTYNNRVLVWNSIPTQNGQAADMALGQTDFESKVNSGVIDWPYDIATDGTRLAILGNQMPLAIWNTAPTTSMQAPDFTLDTNWATVTSSGVNYYNGLQNVAFMNGKLLIQGGNWTGTYVYNSIPTSSTQLADYEIGSHDFTTGTTTALNMMSQDAMGTDGTHVFISDGSRIMIYNGIPANSTTKPNLILGQSSNNTNYPNFRTVNAQNLSTPSDVMFVGSKVVVADTGNNRVLIWNSIPTTSNKGADVVVGQSSINAYSVNLPTMSGPRAVASDGTRLFVADSGNNRVLIWNTIPTSHGVAPDVVLGQANINNVDWDAMPSQSMFRYPCGVATDGQRLVVSDFPFNRVLIWNSIPTSNNQPADVVLGQHDFTGGYGHNEDGGFWRPSAVRIFNGKLLVADTGNARVQIWNTMPTANFQLPDVIVDGGFNVPADNPNLNFVYAAHPTGGMAVDSYGHFYLADTYNNRILAWNTIPTASYVAPDKVLGQEDFSTAAAGESSLSLNLPFGLAVKDNSLWIADSGNFRVLRADFKLNNSN